jgi:tRNA(adenine34) deaminase
MLSPFNDEYFMKQAYLEAQKAFDADEVPVGAVIVCKNQIIARGHNLTEQLTDVTAHTPAARQNAGPPRSRRGR